MTTRRRLLGTAALLIFNLIVAVAVVEIVLAVGHGGAFGGGADAAQRPRCCSSRSTAISNDPSSSSSRPVPRYDAELTYILKPGGCTFANVEFSTELRVNRAGLRDDDAALEAPDVIVLGDSYAMGWGVQQDETLPRVLARASGRKVLNAGISSYGTVREMKLLDRLDTSNLKALVVQYHDSDVVENLAFRDQGGRIPVLGADQYKATVDWYLARQGYWPGKYMSGLFLKLTGLEAPDPNAPRMPAALSSLEEAKLFLNVLEHGTRKPLDDVKVIVFEASEQIRPPRSFLANVAVASRGDDYPAYIRRLRAVDIAPLLEETTSTISTTTSVPSGHAKVGQALAELANAP